MTAFTGGAWNTFAYKGYTICRGVRGAYGMKDSVVWFEGPSREDVCKQIDVALAEE